MGGDPAELAYGHCVGHAGRPGGGGRRSPIAALRRAGPGARAWCWPTRATRRSPARPTDEPVDIRALQTVVLRPAGARRDARRPPARPRSAPRSTCARARGRRPGRARATHSGCVPTVAADALQRRSPRSGSGTLDPALLALQRSGRLRATSPRCSRDATLDDRRATCSTSAPAVARPRRRTARCAPTACGRWRRCGRSSAVTREPTCPTTVRAGRATSAAGAGRRRRRRRCSA